MKNHFMELLNKDIIIIIIIIIIIVIKIQSKDKTRSRLYDILPLKDNFLPVTTQQFWDFDASI